MGAWSPPDVGAMLGAKSRVEGERRMHQRRALRAMAAAGVGGVLLLAILVVDVQGAGASAGSSGPTASAQGPAPAGPKLRAREACARAAEMLDSGRPDEAIALVSDPAVVAETPRPQCLGRRRDQAYAAKDAALFWVAAGNRALGRGGDGIATAREYAALAAASDAKAKGLADLDDAIALRTTPWTGRAGQGWSAFRTTYFDPLGSPLLVALATGVGLLVLARVLIMLRMPWRKPGPPHTGALLALGAVGVVVASVGVALVVPALESGVAFVVAVGIGLGGALAWAMALSARLKVTIESTASGKAETRSATRIVSILRQLGSGEPRGLEVPVGTDVDALDKAITEVKAASWIGTVLSALKVILGFAPWRVVVDRGDAGTAVVVTRNGRTVASTIVRDEAAGAGSPTLDPDLLIAAFVLFTLADGYRNRASFECLLEATEWHSLALVESVRVERYGGSALTSHQKLELLSSATRLDRASPFARIALHHHLYRGSDDQVALEGYGRWLHDEACGYRGKVPAVAVRARLLYSTVAVSLNTLGASPRRADALVRASTALAELDGLVDVARWDTPATVEAWLAPPAELVESRLAALKAEHSKISLLQLSADVRGALEGLIADLLCRPNPAGLAAGTESLAVLVPVPVPVPPLGSARVPLRAVDLPDATRRFLVELAPGLEAMRQGLVAAWRAAGGAEEVAAPSAERDLRAWTRAYERLVSVFVPVAGLARELDAILSVDCPPLTYPTADDRQRYLGIAMKGLGPGDYNELCILATEETMLQAVELLPVALASPGRLEWAFNDPTLAALRKEAAFWVVAGRAAATDVLDQPPFAEHVERLRATGLATPQAVAAAPKSLVRSIVGGDSVVATRLVDVARLAAGLPPELKPYAASIVGALLGIGIAGPSSKVANQEDAIKAVRSMPHAPTTSAFEEAVRTWAARA
jgi:hypothetical protein